MFRAVRLGELNLNPNVEDGASPVDYDVEEKIPHEHFSKKNLTNDIGLIKLKNWVNYNGKFFLFS